MIRIDEHSSRPSKRDVFGCLCTRCVYVEAERVWVRWWRWAWYSRKDRTRRCCWCHQWVKECEVHEPHWIEFRRRYWFRLSEHAERAVLSSEPPVDGKRCPRDMRRLKRVVNRDVAVCPSRQCDYGIDGLTFHNLRRQREHCS